MRPYIQSVILLLGLSANAQTQTGSIPVQVNPLGPVEMINVVVPGQTTRNYDRFFVVNVRNTCFRTNLRGVQNPLGKDSEIRFSFVLKTGPKIQNVSVTYDGKTAIQTGSGTLAKAVSAKSPSSIRAGTYGNVLRLEIPVTTMATINGDGEVIDNMAPVVSKMEFYQKVPANSDMGKYMARTGPLTAVTHVLQPNGSYSMEIQADFPGQEGYCGGYHSPLMVFFDESRPKYIGSTSITSGAKKTYWPEKGAPGYFVAMDKNGDKKIDQGNELFGSSEGFANGFEKLKLLDSNKDGIIDAKDKDFKKLLLFRDWDEKVELIELSSKIVSIDLKFHFQKVQTYGDRAEARESSTFKFKDGSKEKIGDIVDIWFQAKEN